MTNDAEHNIDIEAFVLDLYAQRKKSWLPRNVVHKAVAEATEGHGKTLIQPLFDRGVLLQAGRGYRLMPKEGTVKGRVDVLPDGNVFLRVGGDGAHRGDDVRIPRKGMPKHVLHGDLVEAIVEREGDEPRARVLKVLDRNTATIEGRIEEKGKHVFVSPDDPLAQRSIWVHPKARGKATEGDLVKARIRPFDPDDPRPEAEVLEVLESPSPLEVVLDRIVSEKEIAVGFPTPVMEQAEGLPAATVEGDKEAHVVDLRDEVMVTIDGATAKDFDDAITVKQLDDGGFEAVVAIADVARYVREGTELDRSATDRATSVYFPDRVYPMLPERLSNNLCSLVPFEDRPTVGIRMRFDGRGVRTGSQLFRGWIRSRARLTYAQVNGLLEDGDTEPLSDVTPEVLPKLRSFHTLAKLRIQRRLDRGALDFDLPEPQFVIGLHGEVSEILHFRRRIAHRAVEEMMLAANEAVAELLGQAGLPVVYRCHAEPPPDKYEFFRRFTHNLGLETPPGPTPEGFQRIARAVEGTPFEKSVNVLILRTMSMAEYRMDNVGHFGLALDDYCHFTSPIRRYPDLINHRWALHFLARGGMNARRSDEVRGRLAELCKELTEKERAAEGAERSYVKSLKARFMEGKVGERYEAVISGVAKFGIFVELEEYMIDGLVSVRQMGGDFYIFDEERMEMRGKHSRTRFRMGDLVEVELVSVDVEKGFIDFRLLAHHPLKYGRALERFRMKGSSG